MLNTVGMGVGCQGGETEKKNLGLGWVGFRGFGDMINKKKKKKKKREKAVQNINREVEWRKNAFRHAGTRGL